MFTISIKQLWRAFCTWANYTYCTYECLRLWKHDTKCMLISYTSSLAIQGTGLQYFHEVGERETQKHQETIHHSVTLCNSWTQKIVSDLIDEANGFHTITKFLLDCLYFLDILHHHIHITVLFKLFNPSETRTKIKLLSDFNKVFVYQYNTLHKKWWEWILLTWGTNVCTRHKKKIKEMTFC